MSILNLSDVLLILGNTFILPTYPTYFDFSFASMLVLALSLIESPFFKWYTCISSPSSNLYLSLESYFFLNKSRLIVLLTFLSRLSLLDPFKGLLELESFSFEVLRLTDKSLSMKFDDLEILESLSVSSNSLLGYLWLIIC